MFLVGIGQEQKQPEEKIGMYDHEMIRTNMREPIVCAEITTCHLLTIFVTLTSPLAQFV